MRLFNTESRQKEEIKPLEDQIIRLYTCGPTVYNFAHIGNFRTYVFEDLLRRSLKFFGYKVTQVMNITDIDDKTLKGAREQNKSLRDFTEPFTQAFFEDLRTLNVEPAEYYPKATEYVPQMVNLIKILLKKGIAYVGHDKSIYYSIRHFPQYGRLSHLQLEELQAGASERVAADEYNKENVADFVLWKAYEPDRDGDIYWESELGPGRPGWHIECSAMSMSLLGETLDIHVGGVDNMFPHHENEIAQSEGCTGKCFVRHWMHSEHLLVDHKKMSKSLGNFFTLRDLLKKGYTGQQVRFMLLQTHYRTQLNFTLQGLDAAGATLQRLADFIERLKTIEENIKGVAIDPILKETEKTFREALADDLNISPALAALFDLVRHINQLCDQKQIGREGASKVLAFLAKLDSVLGVLPLTGEQMDIPAILQEALERREAARKRRDFAAADHERAFILAQGYLIEDTPKGPRLKKN